LRTPQGDAECFVREEYAAAKAAGMTMMAASGIAHSCVAGVPSTSQREGASCAQQFPPLLEVPPAPGERHRDQLQREEPRGHQRQQYWHYGLPDHWEESREEQEDGDHQRP
jgi:hypothetical protein